MPKTNAKKESPAEIRMVVEVDGTPVGFLNLDLARLWPLISHRKREHSPVEWMDDEKFEAIVRAAVVKRLMARMANQLYGTLGNQMVQAELDVESFQLKAEAAAKAFGAAKGDIEKLVSDSGRAPLDFYSFFWDYLLDKRDTIDLKKEWKAWGTPPR